MENSRRRPDGDSILHSPWEHAEWSQGREGNAKMLFRVCLQQTLGVFEEFSLSRVTGTGNRKKNSKS